MAERRPISNSPIFTETAGGKDGARYQGKTTVVGSKRFEAGRARLAKLVDREKELVSDGDTFEFLARGESDTIAYLTGKEAAKLALEAPAAPAKTAKKKKRK